MNAFAAFLARPGVQSSEFKVLTALTAWLGLNADQHFVTLTTAAVISAPGVVYAIARGYAKAEGRLPVTTAVPVHPSTQMVTAPVAVAPASPSGAAS